MDKAAKIFVVKVIVCMFVSLCFAGISMAQEPKKLGPGEIRKIVKKPDLIVENIQIRKIAQDPRIIKPGITPTVKVRHKVQIIVRVKNKGGIESTSTAHSLTAEGRTRRCGGAFKILVEWSDNPLAGFNYLGEAGISALNAGASRTSSFTQWVPFGAARKYRATVDHLEWIDEWDERNNIGSAGYIAR